MGEWDGRDRRKAPRREGDVILAQIERDIKYLAKSMEELRQDLRTNFVTRHEFEPVRMIVYGMVALILTSVMAALLALIAMN